MQLERWHLNYNHQIFQFKAIYVHSLSLRLTSKDENYLAVAEGKSQMENVTFGLTRREEDSHKHARGESDSCG